MERDFKALLIIDMQNDFVRQDGAAYVPGAEKIIEHIAGEINYAREKGRPIIYICQKHRPDDPEFQYWPPHAIEGTRGAEIVDDLAPQPGDVVIHNWGYSAFFQTDLEKLLDDLEVEELRICGLQTNTCVLYTAMDALQRGFRVVVPETCVASGDEEAGRVALRQICEVLKPLEIL